MPTPRRASPVPAHGVTSPRENHPDTYRGGTDELAFSIDERPPIEAMTSVSVDTCIEGNTNRAGRDDILARVGGSITTGATEPTGDLRARTRIDVHGG